MISVFGSKDQDGTKKRKLKPLALAALLNLKHQKGSRMELNPGVAGELRKMWKPERAKGKLGLGFGIDLNMQPVPPTGDASSLADAFLSFGGTGELTLDGRLDWDPSEYFALTGMLAGRISWAAGTETQDKEVVVERTVVGENDEPRQQEVSVPTTELAPLDLAMVSARASIGIWAIQAIYLGYEFAWHFAFGDAPAAVVDEINQEMTHSVLAILAISEGLFLQVRWIPTSVGNSGFNVGFVTTFEAF